MPIDCGDLILAILTLVERVPDLDGPSREAPCSEG